MKKKIYLYGILLLILSHSLFALSLSGTKLSPITYKPGLNFTNHYIIGETDAEVEVLFDKGPFQSISVTEVVNSEFDLIIDFPASEKVPPGSYSIGITVKEKPPQASEGGGISTLITVSKNIEVIVYSYEKDIEPALSVANVNVGSNITFELSVRSVGYPDINEVSGVISVFDAVKKKVGGVSTNKKSLPGLEGVTFKPVLANPQLPTGRYSAQAKVFYDGKEETTNATFLIGNMDVLLKEYTSELESGFSEFSATVTNNWGNPIRNVYAKVFLEGEEVLHTPTIDLEAWKDGVLSGIMKVSLEPGIHNGIIHIFFEGEKKEIPLTFTVKETAEEKASQNTSLQEEKSLNKTPWMIFGISMAIAVAIACIWLWRRQKSNIGIGEKTDEL